MAKEVKKCPACKKKLALTNFSPSRKDESGKILAYSSLCKKCRSEYEGKRRKQKAKKVKETITHTITDAITILTPDELKGLRELIGVKDQLLDLLIVSHNPHHNDTITTNKAERIKKTYNVDPSIIEVMNEYSRNSGMNQSDIVNEALLQYLTDHKKDHKQTIITD
jgi:CRISPR/Cas system-associated protein Cas10 (large subunit of type III CRISPR-Cas system)